MIPAVPEGMATDLLSAVNERLRTALSASGAAAAWDWDITNGIIVGDTHFAALYGLTPEKAASGVGPKTFFSIIHPEDQTRIRLAVGGMLRGAELFSKEYRLLGPDGLVRWVHARGRCHYGEQDQPTHFDGVLVDVTEQKRVEEQLRIAQTAGGIGTFEYIDGFATAAVSAQFCALLGLHPASDLPLRTINAVVDPRDPLIIDIAVRPEAGVTSQAEFRITRPDSGEIRWVKRCGEYLRDTVSSGLRFVGVIYDVTEAKRTEERLRTFNETLESRVEERTRERDRVWRSSQDLFVLCGFDGFYRSANPAWQEALGYAPSELLGMRIGAIVCPEDVPAAKEQYALLVKGAVVRDVDLRLRAKDGSYRWFSWTCIPEGDEFYAAGRDITDRKLLEDQLRQSQKMEAVGQLTGGLAHDFNNLLTGITGSLDMLSTRLSQGRYTDLDRFIAAAQAASTRAAALTHRLLAFSRRQTLNPKTTDINRLIAGMEDLIRRSVGPAVDVTIVPTTDLWTTLVDPNQLENALLNLCINARDAMPDGGRLTIETANSWMDERTAAEREIPPGSYVSLCVSDTGTGMAPDVIKRAFDPFFTTKPLGQGTGLGLSMIYGFARQSGGQVHIDSRLGQGTKMCLDLPRHLGDEDEDSTPASRIALQRAEQGETVLVVDDEPTVRMLITEVLEDLGYVAIEAADGSAGLKILESNTRLDLLITDVGLPGGMNGRQVADAGRALRPDLKVLFITGYAENAVMGSGQLGTGLEVMTKPFSMEALTTKISGMIGKG
jgi:PAS domain S-box-containing protein